MNSNDPRKSAGHLSKEYLSQRKGEIKGEVKRGKGVGEVTGPEGERGGKHEGKGWEERGWKAH